MSAQSTPTDAAITGAFENRAFPRRRAWGAAALVRAEKPLTPSVQITLVNISQGGLQFLVRKELEVFQRIFIEIQLSLSNTKPVQRLAEVRWIVADGKPGVFRVGCAWIERLTYAD